MKKKILGLAVALTAAAAALADTAATYPGGTQAWEQYLAENLQYPQSAKQNGVEGVVHLTVTIKADGTVGPIKVDRMLDPDLEQEAIRLAAAMPAWAPATGTAGKPVESTVKLTVPFILE